MLVVNIISIERENYIIKIYDVYIETVIAGVFEFLDFAKQ